MIGLQKKVVAAQHMIHLLLFDFNFFLIAGYNRCWLLEVENIVGNKDAAGTAADGNFRNDIGRYINTVVVEITVVRAYILLPLP